MTLRSLPGAHNITRAELDNGIVVLVYENFSAQSVVLFGSLPAGSLFEDKERLGLASMTAASLLRGTRRRDFDALSRALEDIGADLDFSNRIHDVSFAGKALAEDLPLLIELLAESLRYPTFPKEEVNRLRGERMTVLQYLQQNTRYRAELAFNAALYPLGHPYHQPSSGTLQSLPRLSAGDLRDFHRRHYGPRGMVITVVGAVKASDAIDIVARFLADWRNDEQPLPPPLPPLAPPAEMHRIFTPMAGKSQVDIIVGTLGPSRYAPDFPSAYLANNILGLFGMMGRIGRVIREELGLAYYAYSRLEGGEGPGAWAVLAGVEPNYVDKTIEHIIIELERLTTELVSEQDLADNQAYFIGRLPLRLESNEGIAGNIHMLETYRLGLDYWVNYPDLINNITRESVLKAAQHYIHPSALVISCAG